MRDKAHGGYEGRGALRALPPWEGRGEKRWEAEGADLEEQAPHPESTLLQTWGHLNICLQHVHREFNQSPPVKHVQLFLEINIRPNSAVIGAATRDTRSRNTSLPTTASVNGHTPFAFIYLIPLSPLAFISFI